MCGMNEKDKWCPSNVNFFTEIDNTMTQSSPVMRMIAEIQKLSLVTLSSVWRGWRRRTWTWWFLYTWGVPSPGDQFAGGGHNSLRRWVRSVSPEISSGSLCPRSFRRSWSRICHRRCPPCWAARPASTRWPAATGEFLQKRGKKKRSI